MGAERPSPATPFDHAALDATERTFWRDLWDATPPALAAERGVVRRSFGPVEALAIEDLPELGMLNLVLGGGEPGAAADGHLAAAIEWMEERGVRCYVPVAPEDPGATAAGEWLRAHGFAPGYGWMKFVRRPTPVPEPDRAEPPVTELGPGEGGDFGAIVAAGFGLPEWAAGLFADLPGRPGWRCYVASVDGAAGGAAAMRVHRGTAELGLAATLERARGRGCQTALLRRRLADAAESGCDLVFVETGERAPGRPDPSYRNILRAGFEEAYRRPNWQQRG